MRFDSYHPVMNFLYFAAALTGTIWFRHPVYLMISCGAAFFYSVLLNGRRALIRNLCLLPLAGLYAILYAFYHHFGITALGRNFIGNEMTLESLVYGAVLGLILAAVVMWCSCIFTIVSADKVVYLFGRISPKMSLFLTILLRGIPRIGKRVSRMELAREGIGMGGRQGTVPQKARHSMRIVSALLTWTLDDTMESAMSMRCRGYSLKHRTAFSIYRFDQRDRALMILLFTGIVLQAAAAALNQTYASYDPQIIWYPVTARSAVFYIGYGVFLLLPALLQITGEWKFRHS